MPETVYSGNFAACLPQPLTHDPKITALARAAAEELLKVSGLAENVTIYQRIDSLPEELVDILAYDMHIDWYDCAYPLETKRRLVKNSVKVHKKLGTKYAVETVLKDVYRTAEVEEWFEYGGRPYTFRVRVGIGDEGLSENTSREIEKKMWFYKNLRSHCGGIFYRLEVEHATASTGAFQRAGAFLKVKPLLKKGIAAAGRTDVKSSLFIGSSIRAEPGRKGEAADGRCKIFYRCDRQRDKENA